MKRVMTICCVVLLLFQATAFAIKSSKPLIANEEMYIGGIGLHSTLGYVKSIYGEPREIKWHVRDTHSRMGIIYHVGYVYSDSFIVTGRKFSYKSLEEEKALGEDDIHVVDVFLKDNSLTTPSGWTVGMPYASVVETLGEVRKRTGRDADTSYYDYHNSPLSALTFLVNSEGIITGISLFQDY